MLDKNDLKLIDELLVKRIGEEIKPMREDIGILKTEFAPMREDIGILKREFGPMKEDIGSLKKGQKTMKDDISHIRKDVKTLINYFDREYLDLRKRVERIEARLKILVA